MSSLRLLFVPFKGEENVEGEKEDGMIGSCADEEEEEEMTDLELGEDGFEPGGSSTALS